ncbi:DUF998 domain-containing protein [Mycetocola tolaasinivorans]|uniref:DUF998 domain-containing protein n=1 Tax=Mycetocola tolaasinivorans TaxID=76635 RepID=A0A3L7A9X7_9MICO|nr:DUF998 domain-containing protein [Mycetocola tolaasinivorans]RLP76855.1 DUF998 domain-containing protein [Mycetocola tolaasinivorans]
MNNFEPSAAASARPDAAASAVRTESRALYAALTSAVVGGVLGLVLGLTRPLPLVGEWSFGNLAAIAAGLLGAAAAATGYALARRSPGQEWRREVPSPLTIVSFSGVVIVHGLLASLTTLATFLLLGRGFIGLILDPFWSVLLMGTTTGLTAWIITLSVSRLTTVRMSSLLMAFVGLGTLTSMVTASDPDWWRTHFSHLGTFGDLSSLLFNGTLIVGGLMVTAFAIYVSNDMRPLVDAGQLRSRTSPRTVARLFIVMGVMLAGVGIVPVHVSLLIHNVCASGMAVAFGALLISGPRVLAGMPRAYFVASWLFLAAMLVSVALFAMGFFGLTAFEILVFAMVFGWMAVFIRFLATARPD